jgi:DNA-binding protein YbaB
MAMKKATKSEFHLIHPNAAGIDIASDIHYVSVPVDRDILPVRNFGSFTENLFEIARWLKQCRIDTVAMESTGIYWVQLYLILEDQGFDVFLVNARHIKNVTGRKSDVLDCQWIQQLHSFGLLNKSFQPKNQIRELRAYMRHRKSLTEAYATQIQLMQKAFEQMNIKLHNVLTDISGKSGQLIIKAILSGERDPEVMAKLADKQVKASQEEIIKSLTGNWRDENVFELKQAYETYLFFKEKVSECDVQIENVLQRMEPERTEDIQNEKISRKVYTKNRFNFNCTNYLNHILGVDITKVYGISEVLALEIISETGIDMTKWPTKKHFTSWLNLAPNNRVSGGKLLKPKRIKKKNKAGQAFLMAAYALQRSDHWLGSFLRRIKSKHGPTVAIKATARKLALIFYDMVKLGKEFNPIDTDLYEMNFNKRKIQYLKNQAAKYGFELTQA